MRNFLLILILLTSVVEVGNCGFLISITHGIEGHVVDAETGQPIQNAVITARWDKEAFISMGPTGFEMGPPTIVITDANGDYKLPLKIWFGFRGPTGIGVNVEHWAYQGIGDGSSVHQFYKKHRSGGVIRFDAKLVPLDLVYKSAKASDLNIVYDGDYFGALRRARIPFDTKTVFEKWDEWTALNPSRFNLERLQRAKQSLLELKSATNEEIDKSWRESF